MCDPTAIAATQFIAAGFRAFGVLQQSRAERNESDFKNRIAQNNANIAFNNADRALEKGEADIADKRRETRQRKGLQIAQLAAQGFDISQGTSIDILGDTAALGELDVLRIEADAENQASNFRAQGTNFETEVALGRVQKKNIRRAGRTRAVGTLITGAGAAGSTLLDKRP